MTKPLYKAVKTTLLERIRSGDLAFGDPLPNDADLAEEFGCARLTVHRAMRELADEGYVERRRRAGTRVATRASRGVQLSIARVDEEIFARHAVYRYERLLREKAAPPAAVATAFAFNAGQKALHIRCRHWADDRVFQLEDRWINIDAVPEAAEKAFLHYGPNHWLLEHVPFSEVRHDISAVCANAADAAVLEVAAGHALLRLRRMTMSTSGCITVAELKHPGELFSLCSDPHPA
ncbi:GntR family transcriptional regulator [Defluviimonas aestuarii]|uniref:GntR family transcriptional regulator n=1 Tax=Albidovulum aestuarii TaxID=1130726 RepID=UPI00249A9E1F|nr:GntR family transcriptional regulator [Defluviimonas aestuarii]MDI3335738.1 GntR family transcriptional regulator [Defluviimonas aestuarii]